MAEHSPEPWRSEYGNEEGPDDSFGEFYRILAADADTDFDEIVRVGDEADARRIVACVNACRGVPTEALETGIVLEAIYAFRSLAERLARRAGRDPRYFESYTIDLTAHEIAVLLSVVAKADPIIPSLEDS